MSTIFSLGLTTRVGIPSDDDDRDEVELFKIEDILNMPNLLKGGNNRPTFKGLPQAVSVLSVLSLTLSATSTF